MRSTYERCRAYARKCCPDLELDITHQAYILHQKSHGTNLFDRDIYVALRWCKNVWFSIINENRYQYQYENYYYKFSDVADVQVSHSRSADRELLTKEFYEELFRRIDNYNSGWISSLDTKTLRRFTEMLNEGWTIPEITKETGLSPQRLHYYKLKLRKIIEQMQLKNPFVANPLPVKKKITRAQYDKDNKYKEEYELNFDRDADHNESYTLMVHKERNEGLLIVEKEKLYKAE